ncbi:MAG: cation diffusion facilitator family transporter [Myxococcota bacterium]|nr:cation diffusion facilitator family transporter [Myxococcota bacterium]
MRSEPTSARRDRTAAWLATASIAGSFAMAITLVAIHVVFRSQLALAQAADSIADMLAGGALVWAVWQSAQPADEGHPLGHGRAEPIAALVVAVLTGVLAVEVLRTAVVALVEGADPELDWPVAAAFAVKVAFKSGILGLTTRELRRRGNPALGALRVDARNDVLVGSLALVGFVLARFGMPSVDAALAIVIAVYVALSGVRLARENVALLMGAAAPPERCEEIARIVRGVAGVRAIDSLVAIWSGAALHVHVDIAVDRDLPLLAAHAIGHEVETLLSREDDVSRASVHVGPVESR